MSKMLVVGGLCSCIFAILIAPLIIYLAKKLKLGQVVLGYVEQHKNKNGLATMGGFIFIIPTIIFVLVFSYSTTTLVASCIIVSYTLLGFLDDYIKIHYKRNEGLKPYQKIIGQSGIAILVAIFCYKNVNIGSEIILPFTNGKTFDMGIVYPFLVFFIYIATTNAVNLTDGLDGLAGSVSAVYFMFFFLITFIQFASAKYYGNIIDSHFYGQSMLSICLLGSLIGYLCFNHFPASIMMGDTGSLGLGGAVATVAVFSKNPLLIPIIGIMFVVSCISIIVQVIHYKRTKKRVFLMAPFHHHLEKKGYNESKICMWYIAVTFIFGMISLLAM